MHGLPVSLECRDLGAARFFSSFCRGLVVDSDFHAAELKVRLVTSLGTLQQLSVLTQRIGSDFHIEGESLTICAHAASGVWCTVDPHDKQSIAQVTCVRRLSTKRRLLDSLRGGEYRNQVNMTLLRQGFLLPALARLLAERGWATVHAATVCRAGGGLLLTGLNGCGKSGLAAHLSEKRGFSILSDNYSMVGPGSTHLFGIPEPLRISGQDLGLRRDRVKPIGRAFGKFLYAPGPAPVGGPPELKALIRISVGPGFSVKRVASPRFANDLEALHFYLGETPEFGWPRLVYQVSHDINLESIAATTRRWMCAQVPCYDLQIPRASNPVDRYAEVSEWVEQIV